MASVISDYTSKDYEAFRTMLIEALKERLPDYTDTTQTDAGIVLIELLAKGLDIISYYQDIYANEALLTTCELKSSALKWSSLLGYVPKQATAARCKQVFERVITGNDMGMAIYKGTKVKTEDGVIFETISDLYIPEGKTGIEQDSNGEYLYTVDVLQGYTVGDYNEGVLIPRVIGVGNGKENQTFTLNETPALIEGVYSDEDTEFGNISVFVDDEEWVRVDNFIKSSADSPHYIATSDDMGTVTITFGSKLLGRIPSSGSEISVAYRVGGGEQGNVALGTINSLVTNVQNIVGTKNVTIPEKENLGTNIESIESIRINAPAHFRSLDRAVTLQDYADIILQEFLGDIKSVVAYRKETTSDKNYKDTVQVYIQGRDGFDVNSDYIQKVKDFISTKIMIGTFVEVYKAKEQPITIKASLAVLDGYSPSTVARSILDLSYEYISHSAFNIGEEFEIPDYEQYIQNNVLGVKYFRVNTPTSLISTPNRGSYFNLSGSEDSSGNNPNLKITIVQ